MIRRLLVALLVPASLVAQAAEPVKTTSVSVDLGFVNASGNTSVTTLNLGEKIKISTPDKKIIFSQLFDAVRSKADGAINAANYRGQLRLDYGLSGRVYLFGLTGWDRNVPGGVSRRFEETIGVAYKVLARPSDELGFEVGLSLFQQRNVVGTAGSLDDNYKAGRAAGFYKHVFAKSSFFTEVLELIPNFDNSDDFRFNNEFALIAPISTQIGIKFGYIIRYDNLPGFKPTSSTERLKKTDRFLTAGITASY